MDKKFLKNKPVGYHEVDYLLSCNHVNAERIEAVLFVPKVGDKRTCLICKTEQHITRMGSAYWMDEEDDGLE